MIETDNSIVGLLSLWNDYGRSKIGIHELINSIHKARRLREVSIDITSQCNFSCSYCSYGFNKLHKRELTIDEWKRVIDDCLNYGAKLFALAGREPLINDRFKEILSYLREKSEKRSSPLIYGLITNGWFLKDKADQLAGTGLSYLDVSIDGHREVHDRNRKQGSYDRAIEGLLYALEKKVADKFFVSSVLHGQNYRDMPSFIKDLYDKGIRNFNLSLIYPTPKMPHQLLFSKQQLGLFLNDLLPSTISEIRDGSDLCIVIDIFTAALPFLREMVVEKTIDVEEMYVDEIDSLFNYIELPNGTTIYKRFSLDHLSYGKSVKFTADGYCMADYESLTKPDYWNHAIGNILDEPVSVLWERLYNENSYIYRLAEQVEKKICPNEPCYPLCLGKNDNCSYRRNTP